MFRKLFLKKLRSILPPGFIVVRVRKKGRTVRRKRIGALGGSPQLYLQHKELARMFVSSKLEEWNKHYGFTYGKVVIRNQRSRWGSCSKKGNLNFNYRIMHLPAQLADYIIVHELCHLGEFSHSKEFWALVGKTIPDHKERRKSLSTVFLSMPMVSLNSESVGSRAKYQVSLPHRS